MELLPAFQIPKPVCQCQIEGDKDSREGNCNEVTDNGGGGFSSLREASSPKKIVLDSAN
jgi:hypothetical protein